jgi:hypothetical protein
MVVYIVVTAPDAVMTLENYATVTADQSDPNAANNEAWLYTDVGGMFYLPLIMKNY